MTKLNFFSKIFLSLSIIFTFAQCQKSVEVTKIEPSKKELVSNSSKTFHTTNVSYTNELNPYDYIGKLHNDGLDYFIKNVSNPQNTSVNEIFDACGSFTTSLGFPESSVSQVNNAKFIEVWTNFQKSSDKGAFLLSNNYISKSGYNIFSEMNLILDDCSINNQEQQFILLKALEQKIMNNESDLSEKEKGVLLAASAVGRYSLMYWSNQIVTNGIWIKNKNSTTSENYRLIDPKAKDIVKSDVCGAIAGGLIGAATGGTVTIALGGIGAVPAWVAGAVLTGAGASATKGLEQLWDWAFN